VQRLGRLSPATLAAWLGCAAIFALPARYEPFGLSALEAGLAGCALVLGDIPSLRDIWDGAALFMPPEQPAALADTLRGLIKHAAHREHWARQARRRALEYTPERMAQAYVALYAELMQAVASE
jgi:glycogen synthase